MCWHLKFVTYSTERQAERQVFVLGNCWQVRASDGQLLSFLLFSFQRATYYINWAEEKAFTRPPELSDWTRLLPTSLQTQPCSRGQNIIHRFYCQSRYVTITLQTPGNFKSKPSRSFPSPVTLTAKVSGLPRTWPQQQERLTSLHLSTGIHKRRRRYRYFQGKRKIAEQPTRQKCTEQAGKSPAHLGHNASQSSISKRKEQPISKGDVTFCYGTRWRSPTALQGGFSASQPPVLLLCQHFSG